MSAGYRSALARGPAPDPAGRPPIHATDARNPEGAVAGAATLSGLSSRLELGRGPNSGREFAADRSQRRCDLPIASVFRLLRPVSSLRSPSPGNGLRVVRLAGHGRPLDDPEGSPSGPPTTLGLRFPGDSGFPVLRAVPAFADLSRRGVASGLPLRRGRKSRPAPQAWQPQQPIVFRDQCSGFREARSAARSPCQRAGPGL
jgi:hypothetical protein